MQGTLGTLHMDTLLEQSLEDFLKSLLPENIGGLAARTVVEVLLAVIKILVDVLTGKSDVDVFDHWLDIDLSVDEECLSFSVWTPGKPDGEERPEHPVVYFLFGLGFNSGFPYRMGAEIGSIEGDCCCCN